MAARILYAEGARRAPLPADGSAAAPRVARPKTDAVLVEGDRLRVADRAGRLRADQAGRGVEDVAHLHERVPRVARELVALPADFVGQPLVMKARRVDGLLRAHAEVDDVHDDLQHTINDGAASGAAGD